MLDVKKLVNNLFYLILHQIVKDIPIQNLNSFLTQTKDKRRKNKPPNKCFNYYIFKLNCPKVKILSS